MHFPIYYIRPTWDHANQVYRWAVERLDGHNKWTMVARCVSESDAEDAAQADSDALGHTCRIRSTTLID